MPMTTGVNDENQLNTTLTYNDPNLKFVRPSEFVRQQPRPNDGFILYGCCFSNQDE